MNNLITFPNQKVVIVEDDCLHNERPYCIITERERIWAGRLLNDKTASHILYYCIAGHSNGYKFALSPTAINNYYGISKKQYHSAIAKLIEVGYLVQKSPNSNTWIFKRIPDRYKNMELIVEDGMDDSIVAEIQYEEGETETTEIKVCDSATDTTPLEDILCVAYEDKIYTQKGDDVSVADTEILNSNINNNINNNISSLDSINIFPRDKDTDSYPSMDIYTDMNEADESLVEIEKKKIIEEFGWLYDDLYFEFIALDKKIERKHLPEAEQINLYRQFYNKLLEKKRLRHSAKKFEYKKALENTIPKDDFEHIKVKMIIDKYIETHKDCGIDFQKCRGNYGLWIDGWDEELKEPKIKFALHELPIDLVRKQQHRYEDIPKEYYLKS